MTGRIRISSIMNFLRSVDDLVFDNFGPIRALFVVRNNFGAECLAPMIQEFETRKNIKIGVTHELDGCCDWSVSKDVEQFHRQYFTSEKVCVYQKWHYVITTDFSNLYFRRHTTLVLCQHGATIGNGDYDETLQVANSYQKTIVRTGGHSLYFSNSEESNNLMKSYAVESGCLPMKLFFTSGFAKTDKAFGNHQSFGEAFLKSRDRFAPSKKVVVISSTWTEKSLFRTLGCDFVEDLCKALGNEYTVFVTGHDRLWSDDRTNLEGKFELMEREYSNLCFLPHVPDTFGLISCGDIFIGDNSSIFLEYCLVDKPILFFDNPEFIFSEKVTEDLYKSASTCFHNPEKLSGQIKALLSEGDKLRHERKQLVDYFLSNQGGAAKYTADTIEKLGRISGPLSTSWEHAKKNSSQK